LVVFAVLSHGAADARLATRNLRKTSLRKTNPVQMSALITGHDVKMVNLDGMAGEYVFGRWFEPSKNAPWPFPGACNPKMRVSFGPANPKNMNGWIPALEKPEIVEFSEKPETKNKFMAVLSIGMELFKLYKSVASAFEPGIKRMGVELIKFDGAAKPDSPLFSYCGKEAVYFQMVKKWTQEDPLISLNCAQMFRIAPSDFAAAKANPPYKFDKPYSYLRVSTLPMKEFPGIPRGQPVSTYFVKVDAGGVCDPKWASQTK